MVDILERLTKTVKSRLRKAQYLRPEALVVSFFGSEQSKKSNIWSLLVQLDHQMKA